jgi:uncharacterized membrane protein (GlpM family)
MPAQLWVKFLFGGAIVSVFAVAGEVFKPKTFSGLFGAAPSVALVSLALASCEHGKDFVATEARSMVIGACALFVYSAACVLALQRRRWPVWLSSGLAWAVWVGAAAAMWFAGRSVGVLR